MLIAAVGLAGAGKTTALRMLSRAGVGAYEYVGGFVRREVSARGLKATPENEQAVRSELRATHDREALARLALPELRLKLAIRPVLIDAICSEEERAFYTEALDTKLVIIGVEAPLSLRFERLSQRQCRPMSLQQLAARDRYEIEDLRIGEVLLNATTVIQNDNSLSALQARLGSIASDLSD